MTDAFENRRARDAAREVGRRDLIKLALATGAAYGLSHWKVLEVLAGSGGVALADDAACQGTNRSVHIVAGSGGFAWFQLLWPHVDVARARNDGFAWHAIGEETEVAGTDKPLIVGPETPFRTMPGRRQISAFMAGNNETHTRTPSSSSSVAMGADVFGVCAAMQTASPTLVPVIAIDDVPFRGAPGAPRPARVGSADDIVSLFDSAASRAGGALSQTRDADLYASTYAAMLALRRASSRPTMRAGLATGVSSARLLGRNMADALRVTDADLARYGVSATSRGVNTQIARSLIITAKAFARGLTSQVILPAFRDDPHGAFNDMGSLRRTVREAGASLDAFMADLMELEDPTCGGTRIGENTVISIHGDTPKNPLDRGGWPDGTPGDTNWTYVLGAGHLKTGWFGGIRRGGGVVGYDPTTGNDSTMSSAVTANAAAAAITYAVARGDMRRVSDFYRGTSIRGLIYSPTT
ncbi:MAG: hypothetical protein J0L92_30830 [Deltaproteobacteria bacterium]|nr:hypothetical protein [Deltaproteobacteria bacterium]